MTTKCDSVKFLQITMNFLKESGWKIVYNTSYTDWLGGEVHVYNIYNANGQLVDNLDYYLPHEIDVKKIMLTDLKMLVPTSKMTITL